MAHLEWSDALSLDLPLMDDTHREFVDLLASVQRSPDDQLPHAWQKLIDHTDEHFGQEDRWMLATRFAAANCHSMQHKVVLQVMREGDAHDRLRGWDVALHAWADAGADVVMGGHIHLPYVMEMSTALPHLGRRVWCVQAGTALSSRVRWEAPNSVNLLRQNGDHGRLHWQVERWDFIAASGAFELVKAQQMVLDRSGTRAAGAPSQG